MFARVRIGKVWRAGIIRRFGVGRSLGGDKGIRRWILRS